MAYAGSSAQAAWVYGQWVVYPYKYFTNYTVSSRPFTVQQSLAGRTLADIKVSNVPVNAKGINVTGTIVSSSLYWSYRNINVNHCEISGVWRTPGAHNDFIRICGRGFSQNVPSTIRINDVDIHDGQGLPVFLESVFADTVTLSNLRVRNTTTGIQIGTGWVGYINTIVIDSCPNVGIAIFGRPGSIKTVYIKNSPGLRISDCRSMWGQTGCKFVYLN